MTGWNPAPVASDAPRPISMGEGGQVALPGVNRGLLLLGPLATAGALGGWFFPNPWVILPTLLALTFFFIVVSSLTGEIVVTDQQVVCQGRFLGGEAGWTVADRSKVCCVTVVAGMVGERTSSWHNAREWRWAYGVSLVYANGRKERVTRLEVDAYHGSVDRAGELAAALQVPFYVPEPETAVDFYFDPQTRQVRLGQAPPPRWQWVLLGVVIVVLLVGGGLAFAYNSRVRTPNRSHPSTPAPRAKAGGAAPAQRSRPRPMLGLSTRA